MKNAGLKFVACALVLVLAPAAKADVDVRVEATHMLSAMVGDAQRVASLLQGARAARAPGPIKCVDGYLSQIDAGVRHGRDDVADIRSATATGDAATVQRALGWLSSRRQAARAAALAANGCISGTATPTTGTVVRVIVDRRVAGPE